MTKIFNGTPHAINVVEGSTFQTSIRKYTGGDVVFSIPSNKIINAQVSVVQIKGIEINARFPIQDFIPVFGKSFTGVDAVPAGYDVYIVSAMYASAAKATGVDCSKFYTVADPVYTDDGNSFIGCRGICPAF